MNKNNTLIIFDWDDTLFPTTWYNKGYNNLGNLDNIIYHVLKKFSAHGKLVIVTNAMPIWVESCLEGLPKTKKIMAQLKIDLISARQLYQYRADMSEWKKYAFGSEIIKSQGNIKHVISIGDAEYEYNALVNLYNITETKKILKSVKLLKQPDFHILKEQLEILYKNASIICSNKKHLDLNFKHAS